MTKSPKSEVRGPKSRPVGPPLEREASPGDDVVLAIDTSTRAGGVAICRGKHVLGEDTWQAGGHQTVQVLPAAIIAGVMAEVVRVVFSRVLPILRLSSTQGPFSISVSFLLLVYFETFVVLGGAFLASQAERYPWMGFLKTKRSDTPPS